MLVKDPNLFFKKKSMKLENYGTILKLAAKRLGKSFLFLTYNERECHLLYYPEDGTDD